MSALKELKPWERAELERVTMKLFELYLSAKASERQNHRESERKEATQGCRIRKR